MNVSEESDQLADELLAIIDLPLVDDSVRVRVSDVACSMSLEHWHTSRVLFRSGFLPSGLLVHRAQFELSSDPSGLRMRPAMLM